MVIQHGGLRQHKEEAVFFTWMGISSINMVLVMYVVGCADITEVWGNSIYYSLFVISLMANLFQLNFYSFHRCKAKCRTDSVEKTIRFLDLDHNHGPNVDKFQVPVFSLKK